MSCQGALSESVGADESRKISKGGPKSVFIYSADTHGFAVDKVLTEKELKLL